MTEYYERTEFYVVLVYLLLMIFIGVWFLKRNKGGTDYFAGGRAVPWWVSGVSLYMGNFSAWLFTGGAGMIYRTTGYGLLYFLVTGSVAYFLGSQLTAALWRRSRVISPVEFTRRRFGVGTQQVLGIVTVVVFIAAAGNQLKAISLVVHSVLDVEVSEAAVAIGIIVIAYTIVGGLWAVVVTDVLQFVVLIGVSLLLAPLAFLLLTGGFGDLFGAIELRIPPTDGDPGHDLHFLVAGLISFTLGVASGQGPRFYCVPNERDAKKVGQLAAFLFLTTPVLFSLPPLVARALWGGPAELPAVIPGDNPHERVFIQIAMEVLPPGLLGVFLAAMFAATMSALDTVYNLCASILSKDMYMHFRPDTTDRELIWVGRWMTLLCGFVTMVLCLVYISGSASLFNVMVGIFFLSAPVMAVPVLMGFFFRRAPRSAGMAAIVWGIATGLVTKLGLGWDYGPQIYLTQGISIGIMLVSPWLGSMWRGREQRPALAILALVFGVFLLGLMLLGTPEDSHVPGTFFSSHALIGAYVVFITVTSLVFARTFARDEDRTEVERFYGDLDRPVDVETEVTGSAEAAISVFRLVGFLTYGIAGFVLVLLPVDRAMGDGGGGQAWKYFALAGILAFLATLFLLPGLRRKGARDAA